MDKEIPPQPQHLSVPQGIDPSTVRHGHFGPHDHPILGFDATPEWLGYSVTAYGKGYSRAHMTIRGDMLNGYGIAHGGIIFAFADTCFAWASNSLDSEGNTVAVSSGADIDYLSSPEEGTQLTATGVVRTTRGRSGICDVTVTDQSGQVVAEYRGRARHVVKQ